MQLNLKKIDERIQKLQEVRRIADDPELVSMLFEFIAAEEEPASASVPVEAPVQKLQPVPAARVSEADVVNQAVRGPEGTDSGLWSRKKA